MEEVGVSNVYGIIAEKLFGEEAFRVPHVARPIVREELTRLISCIVAHIWHKRRKTVATQYERLQSGKALARMGFESTQTSLSRRATLTKCMCYSQEMNNIAIGATLVTADVKSWFKAVDGLKGLAKVFSDEDTLKELDTQIERMNWVYKALTGENSPLMMKGESLNLAW
jgi:hypothetical protein